MVAAPKTVLVVEDDPVLRRATALVLEGAGFRVLQSDGAAVGLHLFQSESPDLAILDWTLPDGSGLELCGKIRAHKTLGKTPVIMLTSRRQLQEKAEGFKAGADQYLVKPVPAEELVLWVSALLKRISLERDGEGPLVAGDVTVDDAGHLVRFGDATVTDLTPKEFQLFRGLVRLSPRVLSRRFILAQLWRTVAVDGVVDTHLSNLRKKLPQRLADRIQAVPGKGFRYFP
ncbi:MAG: response regulator transcription factor [Elusimicrobia bacterium]|nr:response regulator transcription factor [Elusimicrobiota bacterium]